MHKQENAVRQLVNDLNNAPPQSIPDHMATVEAMMDHTFEWAQKQLIGSDEDEDESELMPTWMLLTQNGQVVIMATPFDSGSAGKDMVAEAVRKLMREAHVIRYTFMSEAWVATQTTRPTEFDTPPSKRHDRKEVLMITAADRKTGEKVRIYDIVRDDAGSVVELKFKEDLSDGTSEGRFVGMLEVAKH